MWPSCAKAAELTYKDTPSKDDVTFMLNLLNTKVHESVNGTIAKMVSTEREPPALGIALLKKLMHANVKVRNSDPKYTHNNEVNLAEQGGVGLRMSKNKLTLCYLKGVVMCDIDVSNARNIAELGMKKVVEKLIYDYLVHVANDFHGIVVPDSCVLVETPSGVHAYFANTTEYDESTQWKKTAEFLRRTCDSKYVARWMVDRTRGFCDKIWDAQVNTRMDDANMYVVTETALLEDAHVTEHVKYAAATRILNHDAIADPIRRILDIRKRVADRLLKIYEVEDERRGRSFSRAQWVRTHNRFLRMAQASGVELPIQSGAIDKACVIVSWTKEILKKPIKLKYPYDVPFDGSTFNLQWDSDSLDNLLRIESLSWLMMQFKEYGKFKVHAADAAKAYFENLMSVTQKSSYWYVSPEMDAPTDPLSTLHKHYKQSIAHRKHLKHVISSIVYMDQRSKAFSFLKEKDASTEEQAIMRDGIGWMKTKFESVYKAATYDDMWNHIDVFNQIDNLSNFLAKDVIKFKEYLQKVMRHKWFVKRDKKDDTALSILSHRVTSEHISATIEDIEKVVKQEGDFLEIVEKYASDGVKTAVDIHNKCADNYEKVNNLAIHDVLGEYDESATGERKFRYAFTSVVYAEFRARCKYAVGAAKDRDRSRSILHLCATLLLATLEKVKTTLLSDIDKSGFPEKVGLSDVALTKFITKFITDGQPGGDAVTHERQLMDMVGQERTDYIRRVLSMSTNVPIMHHVGEVKAVVLNSKQMIVTMGSENTCKFATPFKNWSWPMVSTWQQLAKRKPDLHRLFNSGNGWIRGMCPSFKHMFNNGNICHIDIMTSPYTPVDPFGINHEYCRGDDTATIRFEHSEIRPEQIGKYGQIKVVKGKGPVFKLGDVTIPLPNAIPLGSFGHLNLTTELAEFTFPNRISMTYRRDEKFVKLKKTLSGVPKVELHGTSLTCTLSDIQVEFDIGMNLEDVEDVVIFEKAKVIGLDSPNFTYAFPVPGKIKLNLQDDPAAKELFIDIDNPLLRENRMWDLLKKLQKLQPSLSSQNRSKLMLNILSTSITIPPNKIANHPVPPTDYEKYYNMVKSELPALATISYNEVQSSLYGDLDCEDFVAAIEHVLKKQVEIEFNMQNIIDTVEGGTSLLYIFMQFLTGFVIGSLRYIRAVGRDAANTPECCKESVHANVMMLLSHEHAADILKSGFNGMSSVQSIISCMVGIWPEQDGWKSSPELEVVNMDGINDYPANIEDSVLKMWKQAEFSDHYDEFVFYFGGLGVDVFRLEENRVVCHLAHAILSYMCEHGEANIDDKLRSFLVNGANRALDIHEPSAGSSSLSFNGKKWSLAD